MNLWLRLLWLLIATPFRKPIAVPEDASELTFHVWFHDLDTSLHMNNGRYLTLMDLGRFDIIARSGLLKSLIRHRWTPIASAISIVYRRELRLFQKFRLETRLLCWNETFVVMEQTFFIVGGPRHGEMSARALFKGGLYDRAMRRFVPTNVLMQSIGSDIKSPEATPEILDFLRSDAKPPLPSAESAKNSAVSSQGAVD